MKPAVPITNPAFRYVDSACTDIRARFEAERLEIAKRKQAEEHERVLEERAREADAANLDSIFAIRRAAEK